MAEVTAYAACPECGEVIDIPIDVELNVDDNGVQRLNAEPYMGNLWAHAWTHEPIGST